MTADSIAAELYLEIGSPCETKPVAISYWLKTNLGTLNNLLGLDFPTPATGNTAIIQSDGGQMTDAEKSVLKQLYIVKYYDTLVRGSLGAASTDTTIEVSSDGGTVRKINKNELSKTYLALKNSALQELKTLIQSYNSGAVLPLGIVGDDTTSYSSYIPTYRAFG